MTLDDLRTINNCTYHKFLNDIEGREDQFPDAIVEAERAGIRAVVEALRNEVCGYEWPESVRAVFDEILASDGTHGSPELDEDARKLEAMGQDAGPTVQDLFPEAFAPAAAPVCEWTATAFDPLGYAWFNSACGLVDFHERDVDNEDHPKCPKCKQTIKFKEAAR